MTSTRDGIASSIEAAIFQVLRDTGRGTAAVEPQMLLAADLGLDSLDLAQTIVLLERDLGVDPFRAPAAAARPAIRTVSDLLGLYRQAVADRSSPPAA